MRATTPWAVPATAHSEVDIIKSKVQLCLFEFSEEISMVTAFASSAKAAQSKKRAEQPVKFPVSQPSIHPSILHSGHGGPRDGEHSPCLLGEPWSRGEGKGGFEQQTQPGSLDMALSRHCPGLSLCRDPDPGTC